MGHLAWFLWVLTPYAHIKNILGLGGTNGKRISQTLLFKRKLDEQEPIFLFPFTGILSTASA